MNRDALLELADRVEKLAGPDREVDCAIADVAGAWPAGWIKHLPGQDGAPHAYHDPEAGYAHWMEAPAYTASLDSAMTLVPEGYDWGCGGGPGDAWAWADGAGDWHESMKVEATTPVLALVAAALRARASTC